jgi:serine/threonine protein kinase
MVRPPNGTQLLGRYTVLNPLGEGGMGLVLAVFDERLNRRVALKLLHRNGDDDNHTRFGREAQAMARLNHPNVVAVYDSGTLAPGTFFLAMEFVEGQTLDQWCLGKHWKEIVTAYSFAAKGLAAAHAVGLIHRDFKPLNVLVGADGRVRVTDFGVARMDSATHELATLMETSSWSESLTLSGVILGTPKYMAPELLRGHVADVRSDVFAFCVALYEALYGQPAFPGDTPEARRRAQLEGRVGPLPRQTSVPAFLGRAVLRGLSVDPARRPATMQHLLRLLEPRHLKTSQLAAALTVSAMVAVGIAGWLRERGEGCASVSRRVAQVWNSDLRSRIRAAMLATQAPFAPDTFERADAILNAYAESWGQLSTTVCQRGGPAKMVLLQEACLAGKLRQFQNLTELLSGSVDQALLTKAILAAEALTPVDSCEDERALTARVPPPELPEVRAQVLALE